MIVYNTTPNPIFIVTKWHADPLGGPAIHDMAYSIGPGQGIDLRVIGLMPKVDTQSNERELKSGGDGEK